MKGIVIKGDVICTGGILKKQEGADSSLQRFDDDDDVNQPTQAPELNTPEHPLKILEQHVRHAFITDIRTQESCSSAVEIRRAESLHMHSLQYNL